MSNTNNGGPAFPLSIHEHGVAHDGMTLRDYFAAKAMQGIMAYSPFSLMSDEIAEASYTVADAMLRTRETA